MYVFRQLELEIAVAIPAPTEWKIVLVQQWFYTCFSSIAVCNLIVVFILPLFQYLG